MKGYASYSLFRVLLLLESIYYSEKSDLGPANFGQSQGVELAMFQNFARRYFQLWRVILFTGPSNSDFLSLLTAPKKSGVGIFTVIIHFDLNSIPVD